MHPTAGERVGSCSFIWARGMSEDARQRTAPATRRSSAVAQRAAAVYHFAVSVAGRGSRHAVRPRRHRRAPAHRRVFAAMAFSDRGARLPIRNPKDFFGGALLAARPVLTLGCSDLPGHGAFRVRPGTAPPYVCLLSMIVVGVGVARIGCSPTAAGGTLAFSGRWALRGGWSSLIPITFIPAAFAVSSRCPPRHQCRALAPCVAWPLAFLMISLRPAGQVHHRLPQL